jgi:hypothetical protein
MSFDIKQIGLWELCIFQAIIYISIWLTNEYLASLVSIIIVPIIFAILLISIISELIEKSKVPKVYFHFMIISILVPIGVAGLMKMLFGTIIWE